MKFCDEKYNQFLTQEDSNRIILSFIKEKDIDVFFQNTETETNINTTPRELFLIGKFVSYIYINNPDLYRDVVNFAVGNIAFNAMYLAPSESNSESLRKCVFFFDSSLIFPLLGIDCSQRKSIVKDIIKEIRSKGGFVKIYQHTYDEIVEILGTAKEYVESPLYNPRQASKALVYLRQEGYSAMHVELIIESIPNILRENFIEIEKQPPNKKLGINENELISEINNNIILRQNECVDKYAERTERDVNSIIYTYEKRKKIDSKNFLDAKYSFITENALLTRSDKKIVYQYSKKNINQADFFPAAIPEEMLCAYLFLGSSSKAVENVTLSILATAYASIRPSAELEALVKDRAKELKDNEIISEDAYNLVLVSHLIKDCLAEKTLSSYENITNETIFDLIDYAKDSIAIEERNKRIIVETKLVEEEQSNLKRKEKANKKAKRETIVYYSIIIFVLCILYSLSILCALNNAIIITVCWAVFCFIINHIKPISLSAVWKYIYKKRLKKAYEYFELNIRD